MPSQSKEERILFLTKDARIMGCTLKKKRTSPLQLDSFTNNHKRKNKRYKNFRKEEKTLYGNKHACAATQEAEAGEVFEARGLAT
jgi:hypothetical protein